MTDDYGLLSAYGSPTDEKTPDETIRVTFHWAARLNGETILTAAYALPDGLTNEDEDDADSVQSILVSGGDEGRTYRVTCTVTTSGSRELQMTRYVAVRAERTA